MKNPIFDKFDSVENQRDAFASYIKSVMAPGQNTLVALQDLEEKNESIMNECDELQIELDDLQTQNSKLAKTLADIFERNESITEQNIILNNMVDKTLEDAQKWYGWTMRLTLSLVAVIGLGIITNL